MLQETGARRQQIEQQSHAGPFAGPKPESMMVPRGARRSDQKAHPNRLEQARRFLPSWPCEFDSRHPLQTEGPANELIVPLGPRAGLRNPSSRAISGPLAVTAASDPRIDRSRNLSIPLADGVLINQCSAHTRVPHPMHQLRMLAPDEAANVLPVWRRSWNRKPRGESASATHSAQRGSYDQPAPSSVIDSN